MGRLLDRLLVMMLMFIGGVELCIIMFEQANGAPFWLAVLLWPMALAAMLYEAWLMRFIWKATESEEG